MDRLLKLKQIGLKVGIPLVILVFLIFVLSSGINTQDKKSNVSNDINNMSLFKEDELVVDKKVRVKGQFRSYNSYDNEKNRLILTVFAKDVVEVEENNEEEENEMAKKDTVTNEVVLVGYICKKPIYRQTPFGREIADILLAVNRAYSKSDYIPCIAWGRTARFCENMEVGTEVKLVGRVQSRQYEKKHEDGTVENKVAYEVSVGSLEVVNQKDDGEAEEAPVEENKEAI